MRNWLPGIWLAALPWAGAQPWTPSWQAIWWVGMVGIWTGFLFGERKVSLPLPVKLLAFWAGLSGYLVIWESLGSRVASTTLIIGGKVRAEQFMDIPVMSLLCVFSAYAGLTWMAGWSKRQTKNAIIALRFSLAAVCVYALLQALGIARFQVNTGSLPVYGGPFGNATWLGTWLAMNVALVSPYALPVLLPLIARAGSMTAAVTSLIVLGYKRSPKVLITIAGIFCIPVLVLYPLLFMDGVNPGSRTTSWLQALDFWKAGNIWTGQGLGAYFQIAHSHCHNEYLETVANLGLIGLGLLLFVMVDAFSRVQRLRDESRSLYGGLLAAGAFSALTLFPFHWVPTGMLILFALARTYSETG